MPRAAGSGKVCDHRSYLYSTRLYQLINVHVIDMLQMKPSLKVAEVQTPLSVPSNKASTLSHTPLSGPAEHGRLHITSEVGLGEPLRETCKPSGSVQSRAVPHPDPTCHELSAKPQRLVETHSPLDAVTLAIQTRRHHVFDIPEMLLFIFPSCPREKCSYALQSARSGRLSAATSSGNSMECC